MDYANIITQAQRTATVPGGIYGAIDYHGEPPWGVAMAAGWRKLDARAPFTPPEGYQVVGYEYEQDETRADYALETVIVDAIPIPTPERFALGIDAATLILDAVSSDKGAAFAATDDGHLVFCGFFRESPYKTQAERDAMRDAAVAAHGTRKAAQTATVADIAGKAAGAGNSIPALRAEVVRLANLVAQLIGGAE